MDGGSDANAAYANFANTIDLSFEGGNVTALPSTIGVTDVPEPASVVLVLAGVLLIGVARGRCSDQPTIASACRS